MLIPNSTASTNQEELKRLLARLKLACVQPANETKDTTDAAWAMILECIAVERLTPEEIERGYRATIRKVPTYRPRYGEWLQACRPATSQEAMLVKARSEAETILGLILDHPLRYGRYSPEVGTVYDRRKVEDAHGRAAGEAFGAIAGRISTMESLADRKWLSIAFCEAYEAARDAYGAPVALTPPALRLVSQAPKALPGSTVDDEAAAAAHKRFLEMIHGPAMSVKPPADWDARKRELMDQAKQLRGEA